MYSQAEADAITESNALQSERLRAFDERRQCRHCPRALAVYETDRRCDDCLGREQALLDALADGGAR